MKLRKLSEDDASAMLEWMNDKRVSKNFRFSSKMIVFEDVQKFIFEANRSFDNNEEYHFAITDDQSKYVGTISLKNIDILARTAEYAIALNYNEQGKGYATFATKEILRFGFNQVHLNKIYLNVLSENKRAIKLYQSCGFHYEGEFKSHVFVAGHIHSLKWFAILENDYRLMYNT